jgi:hypothetical protein
LGTHVLLQPKEGIPVKQKLTRDNVVDRLDELADLAAAIDIGLVGLRQSNWERASHGFGVLANQIHYGILEVMEVLTSERKKERLRVVGQDEVQS